MALDLYFVILLGACIGDTKMCRTFLPDRRVIIDEAYHNSNSIELLIRLNNIFK